MNHNIALLSGATCVKSIVIWTQTENGGAYFGRRSGISNNVHDCAPPPSLGCRGRPAAIVKPQLLLYTRAAMASKKTRE